MPRSRPSTAWGMVVSTVLALILGVLGAPSAGAAPVAPTGLTPNSSSPKVSTNPVLAWDRVPGAATYEVEVSTSQTFSATFFKVSTTNRRAVPTAQLPMSQIWWRVRALDSSRVAGPWTVGSFERSVISGPNLLVPIHDATLSQPDTPPVLTWSPVAGATKYHVEIDGAEKDWVETTTYSTSTTSFVVPNPQENGRYWWRVRADLGTGVSTLPSEEWSYRIGPLPVVGPADLNQPDLVTRPFEDQTIEDVVFDWQPVDGAVSYDIRVSTNDSFDTTNIIDQKVVKVTRYSPTTTYDNDDYWWQVRARDIFGKAQEWTDVRVRQFRREWSECVAGTCRLRAPVAVYPDGDPVVHSDDLYYQWTPVRLASRYRIDVGTDPYFSPNTFKSCFTTQTTYTPGHLTTDLCMPAQGATHYWRVKAVDAPRSPEVQGLYSEPVKFIYDSGAVELLQPAHGAKVDVPTLSWTPARDAERYKVIVTGTNFNTSKETYSTSWTPQTKLDPAKGPFTWTVQSIDRDGSLSPLPLTGNRTFNVSGNVPTTGGPELQPLSPSPAAASGRFPSLTWEPHPDAAYYRIRVGDHGTGYFDSLTDTYYYPAATEASSKYLQQGRYDWYVSAFNSSGGLIADGLTSGAVGTFTVSDLQPVIGHRLALDASGLDGTPCTASYPTVCEDLTATPVLDWDPVPGASHYMVYLSSDRNFSNMVFGQKSSPTSIPATKNTMWTPTTALGDSQAGTAAYYWFIRPCKSLGVCAPDPLEANHAFAKRSNKVDSLVLADKLAPLSGETVPAVANEVTFSWRDYLTTNHDSSLKDPTTGEQAGQAARRYHLQVGTTAAFATPLVDDVYVDQTTYTAFTKTYPEGQLFWRVQAMDGSDNGLTWSDPQEFVKRSPRVELSPTVRPGNGGTARTDQTFRWDALRFAASYDIEVYKNNDTAASSTNRVISSNSKQVAFASTTTLLPVSPDPYVWRVRRVDIDGKKGSWSDWWSFRLVGDAPVKLAPASGASVAGNDALFTWQAVKGAATYKFERRASGSTSVAEVITTAALAYAPISTLPAGTWDWSVTALDSLGKPMASSGWRTLFVPVTTTPPPSPEPTPEPTPPPTRDTRAPYVVSKSPVSFARRRANFVAKFNEPVFNVSGKTMRLFMKGRTTPVRAQVTLSADRKTARLNPVRNLRPGKIYILRLRSGIRDRAGNQLTATSWRARCR